MPRGIVTLKSGDARVCVELDSKGGCVVDSTSGEARPCAELGSMGGGVIDSTRGEAGRSCSATVKSNL